MATSRLTRSKSIVVRDERRKVYFPDDVNVWISGSIINQSGKDTYDVEIDDDEVSDSVMTTYRGKIEDLPLQNEGSPADGVEDMVSLSSLNEATILDNLRKRFKYLHPYTYIGNICMAVNPYQRIKDLYSTKLMDDHINFLRHEVSPHVYGTSATAYKGLRDYNKCQSILVSGESGAGKVSHLKTILTFQ
jgi:myosin V